MKVESPTSMTRTSDSLNIFCWNASNGLLLDEWVTWLTQTSYDVAVLQETGWRFSNQWVSGDWYMLHSHGHRATVLCMIRRRLLRPDQLAWSELCPGRLIHVRLYLSRIHDIICVYQHSWSSSKERQILLHDRLQVFEAIRQCILHVPKSHMLLLAGDCNTPLTADAPHVHSRDPKYGMASQCDKQDFQTLIRDLDLVAVHCQHQWKPTFQHGDHSSRIDFMFVRRHQVQWTKHRAQVLTQFERTTGSSAPVHHPLAMSLPKWFAPPRQQPPINSIDRHRLRRD